MEIIEGTAVEVEPTEIAISPGWNGESPFFLIVEPADAANGNVGIDLDQGGWIEANKELMRRPSTWWLVNKQTGTPVFVVVLEEGDQFYYAKRHIGNLLAGSEIVAVGIGKKRSDGSTVNLWLLPNGVVCGGDDVEAIASRMLGG